MFSAPMLRLFIALLTPLNFIFAQWKKLINKIFKTKGNNAISSEELLLIVDEVEQGGAIDTDESELIRNAIEFNELKAEDILTHRVDLEALADDTPKDEIAKAFTDSRFSRLLVYNESIDNVIGVLHQKDFYVGAGVSEKPISELISPPLFIHKSEKINDLLKTLQREKSHIAVVIDDYGGTLGIVTMEDILEELVGEIWDEHDEVVENFKKIGDDSYIVDGAMDFDDFRTFFDFEYETDIVSLSGWITEQLGKIPANGDQFTFENLHISVPETDSHRVSKAKVVRSAKAV